MNRAGRPPITEQEVAEARAVYAECERLRLKASISRYVVSQAAGWNPGYYTHCVNRFRGNGRGLKRAQHFLLVIQQLAAAKAEATE